MASVGGLIFGFDTAVISGTTESLKHVFHLDDAGLGITVTTALIGTILGALITGKPADKYGRKNVLFAIGILYIIGSFGSALAPNYATLIIARFLGGIGVGASSVCAPIYTAEVSPAKVRGRLVGLVQFNIVAGILLAYLSNYVIRILVHDPVGGEPVAWRWMLGVMAVPSILFVLMLFTVPETPRWLMAVGREKEAIAVSRKLCMTEEESDFQIREIKEALAADASMKKAPFFIKKNMKVIMLAFMIAMFNQLSGINAILYYAPIVMEKAGAATDTAFLMSVGVGAMNLVATMAALTVIDKIGRRTLMIVGSIGYLVSLGFLSVGHVHLRGQVQRRVGEHGAHRPAGVHRGARVRPGFGHLGVHLRDLPEPHPRHGSVVRILDTLGVRSHHVRYLPSVDRGSRRRHRLPDLLHLHGRTADLGVQVHARDQGHPP